MRALVRNSVIIAVIAVFFSSCQRDEIEFVGPEVSVASDNFMLQDSLMVHDVKPNFEVDSALFTARFNERVSWKLIVTGAESCGQKTFEGTADSIAVNWSGESDVVYFFREDESVDAVLEILGLGAVDTVNLTINKPLVYEGYLINDFEGNGLASGSWWQSFKPGELVEFTDRYTNVKPPQGVNSLLLKGEDLGPDGFIGQSGHSGSIDLVAKGFPEATDSLYFNCFVSGQRGSRLEVRLLQTINGSPDGDEYSYFVNVDWEGWKLISAPYSKFNRTGGDGSSPIQRSNAITRVKFVLRTNVNGSTAEVLLDYPVFTIAKPFSP